MKKRRKSVKMRGQKTHGHGSKKKRRGKGSRGGKGFGGGLKHKKLWVMKHDPEHFGKRGFKSLRKKGFSPETKAINLRDLVKLTSETEIDVSKLGYDKVIGSGKLEKPLVIKARKFSEGAKEKIEKAGGKAIVA